MTPTICLNVHSMWSFCILFFCALFVDTSLETFLVSNIGHATGTPVGASSRSEPYIASISPVSLFPSGYYSIQDGRYQQQYPPAIVSAQYVRYPSQPSGTMAVAPFSRYSSGGGSPSSSVSYWAPQTSLMPPFSVGRYCDQQIVIEPKYQQCRSDAILNWRSSSDMHHYYSNSDPVKTCCLFWATLDCMEYAIKRRCDQTSLHYFSVHRAELRNSIESKSSGICHEYPDGAFRCRIQSWIIVIAISVLILFILLVIGGATWILLARKRKGSSSSLASGRNTEALKRYSTARDRPPPPPVVSQSPQRYQQTVTTRTVEDE